MDGKNFQEKLQDYYVEYAENTCWENRKGILDCLLRMLFKNEIKKVGSMASRLKTKNKYCTKPTRELRSLDEELWTELDKSSDFIDMAFRLSDGDLIGYIKRLLSTACRKEELQKVKSTLTYHARESTLRVESRRKSAPPLNVDMSSNNIAAVETDEDDKGLHGEAVATVESKGWWAKYEENILCMDCEMVSIKIGTKPNGKIICDNMVATVSVVNWEGKEVYHRIVKHNPKDIHMTPIQLRITGFKDLGMFEKGIDLSVVQTELLDLFQGKLLIVAGGGSDFDALKLSRSEITDCFDIQGYWKDDTNQPFALKYLVKYYYGVNIQKGVHSATKDAEYTMKLFREHYIPQKLENGKEAEIRHSIKAFNIPRVL